MKRSTARSLLCAALFVSAFAAGRGAPPDAARPHRNAWNAAPEAPAWADSLPSLYLYTEGIKSQAIAGDSLRARTLFEEALQADSTFAPARYELALALLGTDPGRAVEAARLAHERDTANLWYHQLYGQTLLASGRYAQALGVYRRLRAEDPKNPDLYRLLAALYEQQQQPFSAIATLDSAEVRFGRIPMLSAMKRQLLIATRQHDKALEEARVLVESAPYEAERHVVLAELYAAAGRDSLARAEFAQALRIDSTSLPTLLSIADFQAARHDYRALMGTTRRLFALDALPLDAKIRRFEQFTADVNFYRDHYFAINDLAQTLAIRHPRDPRVVELYARHLIASGELEQALALYKLHTADRPPQEAYFRAVIDIESYLQRPDSVNRYIGRALELFPDRAEFRIARGNAFVYAKEYEQAIKAYKNALRYADSDSLRGATWGMIGDTWHQIAETRTANERRKAQRASFEAYERSLALWPDNPPVMNNYAYYLAVEGLDLERALALSSRTVELTGSNPTFLDTHAWVLFRLGRAGEAKKIMQQAIALDGRSSTELMVHYGDILDALGERFIAETYWRKALEKGYDPEQIARRFETPAPDTDRPQNPQRTP